MNHIVIKCGGSVFEKLPLSFYENIVALQKTGKWKPIIVHGGGPLISSLLKNIGVETTFVNGLRVTTNEVLDVVEMALSGAMNKQIVRKLREAGGQGYGISGIDGSLLSASPMDTASPLGFVGKVTEVKTSLIASIIEQGHIPVISPLGIDHAGQRYNINADTAAAAIAQALKAKLCFISDIPGIYVESGGKKETLHELGKTEIELLIEKGVIQGGMIPKVQSALHALANDVPEVSIVNGMEKNSITQFVRGEKIGTKIRMDKEITNV